MVEIGHCNLQTDSHPASLFCKLGTETILTKHFDEERFAALLGLAGQATAVELARRLDEDLTKVGHALSLAQTTADHAALHAQSHILLSIAGTIGATQVFDLSQRLNTLVRGLESDRLSGIVAQTLTEVRAALQVVILRVRYTRSDLKKLS
jgi:hypothetical protein